MAEAEETTTTEAPATEVQETVSVAEQTPIKETAAEETETKEADTSTEAVKSEETETEGEKAEETESSSEDDEAAKKRRNDEMARQRIQNSQKTRQDVLKQVDETYAPKGQDEFIAEGLSESDAKIEALRQEMQFRETRNYIADLNAGLKSDAQTVLTEHPVYNPDSKDYDADFTKEVQEAYQQAARLQTDENGIVINAEVGLQDFYSRMARIRDTGNQRGTVQGQKDALKMLSRTESTGSTNTNSTEKKFEDMSIQEMEAKLGTVRR